MFDYEYTIGLEDASIARYPALIGGWLNRAEWLEAASGWRRFAARYVERGLLKWRHGENPVDDFMRGSEAAQESDALVEREGLDLDRGGSDCDLFARAFALIDAALSIPLVSSEDIAVDEAAQFVVYSRYLSLRLQSRPEADQLQDKVMRLLEVGRQLVDRTYSVYLMLLDELPADGDIDALVAQAEWNWARRKTDRFFEPLDMCEGHGDFNVAYPDVTLAAILRRIGWEGESVHRWKWETPRKAR